MTRQRTRQVKLFADQPSSVDSLLIVSSSDEYFPAMHFDEHCVSMNVSTATVQPTHLFYPDTISNSPVTPKNDNESLRSPQAAQWEAARQEEINSCHANSVWSEPMPLPPGKKATNLGFIYALKHGGNPNLPVRYKARLVFRNHKFATDSTWEDSFSPVVDKTTLRLFFTLVGRKQLFIRQADVVTAYLNAAMPDEVYVKLPSICGDDPTLVRRLLRALYGHPKAGNLWNFDFVNFMLGEGFLQCSRDKCLFFHPTLFFLVVLYVDDLLGACENNTVLKKFWKKLATSFKIRDLGKPTNFLGIEIACVPAQKSVALCQRKYVLDLANKFNIPSDLRPVTPLQSDYYAQLAIAIDHPIVTELPYRELVGSLIFVMVCTRPDIAFAVSCLTQYFSAPRALHWEQALRCLGYLVGTSEYGVLLGAGGPEELVAYSDSDWAGDPVTRRSVGGYLIFFGTSILCWGSKTQRGIIALSSTESEFIQLALSVRQVLFVQPIFVDVGFPEIEKFTVLYGDNLPAIQSIGNDSARSRTKHLDIQMKFCGEVVKAGKIQIKYVKTDSNLADILTKPLPAPRVKELRANIVFNLSQFFHGEGSQMNR